MPRIRAGFLTISDWSETPLCPYCGEGGGIKDFKARLGLNGTDQQQARKIVATYDYHDESGNLLYQVVRYRLKSFAQRCPAEVAAWVKAGCPEEWKAGEEVSDAHSK